MGCVFCATGRLGFRRNLAAWEIVDQVMHIQADSPHPVRGVVFMGMGEPLLNYERVMRAAGDPVGAVRPGHRRQGDHDLDGRHRADDPPLHRRSDGRIALIVSLTSADPEQRPPLAAGRAGVIRCRS